MKTKIIYTVVCDERGVYLAQSALSAYTARLHNLDADILLLVDKKTADIADRKCKLLSDFSEVVVVDVPDELNNMQKSRYLKTTLRHHVKGDYIYIDTDTVITGKLDEVDKMDVAVGAVLDRHLRVSDHAYKSKIADNISVVGLKNDDLHDKYFNSGVLLVKDIPQTYELYDKWYNLWDESMKKGANIDQPPLAKANMLCSYPIVEIDGVWNCQMVDNFLNYFAQAKILHYFATNKQSPYSLYSEVLLKSVFQAGIINDDVKSMLQKPHELFYPKHLLVYGDDIDFIHSNLHSIFTYHRWLYNLFESTCRIIVKKSF